MKVEQFEAEINTTLRRLRAEAEGGRDDIWPRLLSFHDDGKVSWHHIDPTFMNDWRSKNLVGALIVEQCFTAGVKVTIFVSDCLAGSLPEGKDQDEMPTDLKEWPKSLVREFLLLATNARGAAGFFVSYGYTRDGKGRRVFESEPELLPTAGRFCFDLRGTTRASATLDALLRTRNGLVEYQG